jgi:hypothetical protein
MEDDTGYVSVCVYSGAVFMHRTPSREDGSDFRWRIQNKVRIATAQRGISCGSAFLSPLPSFACSRSTHLVHTHPNPQEYTTKYLLLKTSASKNRTERESKTPFPMPLSPLYARPIPFPSAKQIMEIMPKTGLVSATPFPTTSPTNSSHQGCFPSHHSFHPVRQDPPKSPRKTKNTPPSTPQSQRPMPQTD